MSNVETSGRYLQAVFRTVRRPRGAAGIMPRGRGGWHRTGPLAVVRCRAKYWEDGRARWDGRALHARPFLV